MQFLGGMTTLVGILSLFLIGSPSEVPWLTAEEKDIANDRILKNNAGDDRTGNKTWNWSQVVECFKDPVVRLDLQRYSPLGLQLLTILSTALVYWPERFPVLSAKWRFDNFWIYHTARVWIQ